MEICLHNKHILLLHALFAVCLLIFVGQLIFLMLATFKMHLKYIFFKGWHPCGVYLKFIDDHITHFQLISGHSCEYLLSGGYSDYPLASLIVRSIFSTNDATETRG